MRHPTRHRSSPILALLALLAIAVPAPAQDWAGRGRVQGSITDEKGEPVAGAKVILHLSGRPEAGPEPLTTDDNGEFSYLGLENGSWTVRIEAEGMVPSEGSVDVNEYGRTPPVKVQLRPIPADALVDEKAAEAKKAIEGGNELLAAGKPAAARAEYEKALASLEPEHQPIVLQGIAQTHLAEEKPEQAITALQKALALAPGDPEILRLLARAQYQAGQVDASIATLESVLAAPPAGSPAPPESEGDVATLQLLIDLLVRAGREEEAQKYMARLPEGASVSPDTRLNTGIELFNQKKLDEALEQFELAVAENPEVAPAYYYRGLVYLNKGENAKAKADFAKLLELDPESPHAAEAKEFLKYLESQ